MVEFLGRFHCKVSPSLVSFPIVRFPEIRGDDGRVSLPDNIGLQKKGGGKKRG